VTAATREPKKDSHMNYSTKETEKNHDFILPMYLSLPERNYINSLCNETPETGIPIKRNLGKKMGAGEGGNKTGMKVVNSVAVNRRYQRVS
jgi:hypothetical protein